MRKTIILIILTVMLFLVGCRYERSLQICAVFEQELLDEGVVNSKILKLANFSKLKFEISEVRLSKEELQSYVNEVVESYDELLENKKKMVVEKGDFVTIAYESVCEGKVVDENSQKVLKVGAGFFDEEIEESLIGAKKGETYSIQIRIPIEVEKIGVNIETTTITVKKIQYIKKAKLTDAFVKEHYGLENVEEFYCFLKEKREEQIRQAEEINARNAFIKKAMEGCQYVLDEKEILKIGADIFREYEYAAKSYGISVEEYMSNFIDVSGDIYEECYREAEGRVKRRLMLGAIAYAYNIKEEGEEFDIWAREHNLNLSGISEKELREIKKSYVEATVEKWLFNGRIKGDK